MPALLHDVFEEKGKGTPVDYIKTVPPVIFPRQADIYAKAPNPNAAKLFAEWAISTEGQQVRFGRPNPHETILSRRLPLNLLFPRVLNPSRSLISCFGRPKEVARYLRETYLGGIGQKLFIGKIFH